MSFDAIIEKFIEVIEWLITLFLIVIFSLTVILVVLRYLFNSSILGGSEVVTFLFIYTTALGAAVAIPHGRHIRISFFIDKLKGGVRVGVEVLVCLLVAFINGIMLLYSLEWISVVGRDISQTLGIPLGIIKMSVPIGCALAVLLSLYAAYRVIRTGAPLDGESFV
ncbi:MAG: TRAP transporter small permease [bacterium]